MTPVERALSAAARELDALGATWALVGGLAVSARSEPRTTGDVDIAVTVADDPAAEGVVHAFVGRDWRIAVILEHRPTGRLATARLIAPGADDVMVDLLFSTTGIEPEIAAAADRLDIGLGADVPVARAGHLLVMKLLASLDRRRGVDADDVQALAAVSDRHDRRLALVAMSRLVERGFARGHDLPTALVGALVFPEGLATLAAALSDWTDIDLAQLALGRCLGVFDENASLTGGHSVKGVLWSDDPLGSALHRVLESLAAAGTVERRDEPDIQFRWRR